MKILIFTLFILSSELKAEETDIDILSHGCENCFKDFDKFCPKGNRCLSKVKNIVECVINALRDFSSELSQEILLETIENQIDELNVTLSKRIDKLENAEIEKEYTTLEMEKSVFDTIEASGLFEDSYSDYTGNESQITSTRHDSACLYVSREGRFLVTANLAYNDAKQCCIENNASPFVPKSKEEYIHLVVKITSGSRFGWLPLSVSENSDPKWEDETGLEEKLFQPRFTSHPDYSVPQSDKSCVGVTSSGVAYWLSCEAKMKLLCLFN